MPYIPNMANIDFIARAVASLSEEAGRRGVCVEDFCGGVAKGINDVLNAGLSKTDPRQAEILRAAIGVQLSDGMGGDLGGVYGNGQRLH